MKKSILCALVAVFAAACGDDNGMVLPVDAAHHIDSSVMPPADGAPHVDALAIPDATPLPDVATNACRACPQSVSHLGNQLETAGKTWKNYAEDMGSSCNTTAAGGYAPKHVPFAYYDDVRTAPQRCNAHVIDYSSFATDLAAGAPDFSLIA